MVFGFSTKIYAEVRIDAFYTALGAGEIKPGTIIIFRYQGPKGAPGMPEVRCFFFILQQTSDIIDRCSVITVPIMGGVLH